MIHPMLLLDLLTSITGAVVALLAMMALSNHPYRQHKLLCFLLLAGSSVCVSSLLFAAGRTILWLIQNA